MKNTVTTITCDICGQSIHPTERYINANVYGRDYHLGCLEQVNGTIIGQLVDDVHDGEKHLYWDRKRAMSTEIKWYGE